MRSRKRDVALLGPVVVLNPTDDLSRNCLFWNYLLWDILLWKYLFGRTSSRAIFVEVTAYVLALCGSYRGISS